MEVCFHKAIDEVEDPIKAVIQLNAIPTVTRILTSGQRPTAAEGVSILKAMMGVARPDLSIMPAGKVKASNIDELHQDLKAKEYHGRSILMHY
jgi:copper homeostasis protein